MATEFPSLGNPKPSNGVRSESSKSLNDVHLETSNVENQDVKVHRSFSFDPKILQRAPSFHSIRDNKKHQPQLSLSNTNVEPTGKTKDMTIEMPVDSLSRDTNKSNMDISGESIISIPISDEKEAIANIGGCIECVKAIPVFSAKEIEVGDHIVFAGAVYDHHGIIVGKIRGETFKIVEATNTFFGAVIGFSKFFGGKAKICSSEKQFNFKTQNIRVVEYRKRLYSKQDVAKRAIDYAEGTSTDKAHPYKYDLVKNNCEHFATFCVTGQNFSIQVSKVRLTVRLFLSSGFIGISDEQKRNDKEREHSIICEECHDMNKTLLAVNLKSIKSESDVRKGDIIRYSYYNLWHEAVVLDVTDKKQKFIVCRIAHYAFCGFFSHRTIKAESLKINFDGKCSKLEYEPPKFNVYDPEMVIQRANKRIGEQQFVFFSNDSSHFARWCKLELEK